ATLVLSDETVTNNGGTLQVDFTDASHFGTLDLAGSEIDNGTLTNAGTLNSTSASRLHNVGITNTGTLESTSGTLTIDASVVGPTLTNSGTLEANGGAL